MRLRALIEREREEAARDGAPDWLAERVERAEGLLQFMEDFAHRLADHPERGTRGECLAALRRLVETVVHDPDEVLGHLDQLAQLDALTGPIDYARFIEAVRAEIHALKAGDLDGGNQGALGLRGVSVLDVNALRHLRFRAVAVLGLTERSFPPPPRQDPLLLDDERETLNALAGLALRPCPRSRPEPLQFALATSAAREQPLLDAPRGGGGCAAPAPSSFFREAASTLAGRRLDAGEISSLAGDFYRVLRAGKLGPDDPDRALTAAERDIALIERDRRLGTALPRARPRRGPGGASPPGTMGNAGPDCVRRGVRGRRRGDCGRCLAGRDVAASPTVLEIRNVSLRFFMQRLLRARLEEPETIVQLDPDPR